MLRRLAQTPLVRGHTVASVSLTAPFGAARGVSPLFRSLRSIATERITGEQEQAILVEQRKNRPTSPHLEIYQPQLTWYLSGLHRITGVALAFGFYGGLVAYAGFPLIGYPFTFADVAQTWAAAPEALKIATKTLIAFPASFHAWNGIRHLIWDTGKELTLKGVYRTGYAVLGLSVITAAGLALL